MKNLLLTFATILLIFSCKNDDLNTYPENVFNPENNFNYQVYNLTTVSDTVILGKDSTRIYFERSQFEVDDSATINLRLVEFYNFKDLVFNGIATITDHNELLESSGVIYFDVLSNNEPVKLKKDGKIKIQFPANRIVGNQIFMGKVDSLGQFEWTQNNLDSEFQIPDWERNRQFGVVKGFYRDKEVPLDSLLYYENLFKENDELSDVASNQIWPVFLDKYGWINLDKFVNLSSYSDFTIDIQNNKSTWIRSFILYEGLDSFIDKFHDDSQVKLDSIPISGKMRIILIGQKGKKLFYDKIELKENVYKYEAELIETSIADLKEIIKP